MQYYSVISISANSRKELADFLSSQNVSPLSFSEFYRLEPSKDEYFFYVTPLNKMYSRETTLFVSADVIPLNYFYSIYLQSGKKVVIDIKVQSSELEVFHYKLSSSDGENALFDRGDIQRQIMCTKLEHRTHPLGDYAVVSHALDKTLAWKRSLTEENAPTVLGVNVHCSTSLIPKYLREEYCENPENLKAYAEKVISEYNLLNEESHHPGASKNRGPIIEGDDYDLPF